MPKAPTGHIAALARGRLQRAYRPQLLGPSNKPMLHQVLLLLATTSNQLLRYLPCSQAPGPQQACKGYVMLYPCFSDQTLYCTRSAHCMLLCAWCIPPPRSCRAISTMCDVAAASSSHLMAFLFEALHKQSSMQSANIDGHIANLSVMRCLRSPVSHLGDTGTAVDSQSHWSRSHWSQSP